MAMQVVIPSAHRIGDNIWSAKLSPGEVKALGVPLIGQLRGPRSILICETPQFDARNERLLVELVRTKVVKVGFANEAIVIGEGAFGEALTTSEGIAFGHGDNEFLNEAQATAPSLGEIAKIILDSVRRENPGELRKVGRRYLDAPDNFWTVTVQPKVKSLLFTVRGEPVRFQHTGDLAIKPDQHGYSSFKVTSPAQITAALGVLRQAKRRGI